jgi:PAS domain S-box-containing protein
MRLSPGHDCLEMKDENNLIPMNFDGEPFAALVEEIDEYAILLLDTAGNILNWNQSAEKIKGYTATEIVGKHFRQFYTKTDQDAKLPEQLIKIAIETGKAMDEGFRVRKDGETFWGSIVIKALHNERNVLTGFLKVTRRHASPRAEKGNEISAPENGLFKEADHFSSAIVSQMQKRGAELEQEKIELERAVNERTDDLQIVNGALQKSNEELVAVNEELNAMNDRLVEASQLIQKQKETIVQQEDEQLNRVLDSSTDVIWSIDLTGSEKSYISRSAEQLTGLSLTEMIHNPSFWLKYVHNDDLDLRKEALNSLRTVDSAECTYRIIDKNGELRWMNEKMRVLKNRNNLPVRRGGVASDISSLKKAEESLAYERNLLRALIDNIPDHINVKDKDFKPLINNEANAQFLKALRENEVHFNDDQSSMLPNDELELLATGKPLINKEETILRDSGEVVTLLTTKVPFKDQYGNTTGIIAISRDITDRKQAEIQLLKNSHLLSKANEVAGIGYWLCNPLTNEMAWNDQTLEIFGLPKHSKGTLEQHHALIHPDDLEEVTSVFQWSIREQKPFNSEHRIIQPNQSIRWVKESVDFVSTSDEKSRDLIGVVQDITFEKSKEEVLKQFNNRHEILSKATNDAIWDWDIVNNFETWNHGIEIIFGYTEGKEVPRRIWKNKIHKDDYGRILQQVLDCFKTKATNWSSEFRYLCADGSYKHVLSRAYIIYQNGKAVRVIGAMQDITEVIQYRTGLERMVQERTAELNDALKKEKQLVVMKNQFVSIASHEFRTPLSTISLATGFIRKYRNKLTTSAINKKLQNIEKQVDNMTYLLDDVLTIGKADAGKLELHLTSLKFDVIKVIAQEILESKGVKHKLHFSKHCLTKSFISDEKFTRNIITNLITNAIKFSPGEKVVHLDVTSDSKNLFIKVNDSGIGIPPEDVCNLYTSFYRGSNVTDIEGTGLGLSIVKKSIDLLKGSISVRSRVGKGTEFKVTLPLAYA